jgi:nitrate reductase gamma subunit
MTKPDPNRVLRRLPIVVGGLGAVLLLINRLLTPELTESQARGDVVGVILSAVLILTGLIWQQVQPRFCTSHRFTRSRENRTSLGLSFIID